MLTIWNSTKKLTLLVGLILIVAACGSAGKTAGESTPSTYPENRYDKEKNRYGSIFDTEGDGSGFVLWDSAAKKAARNAPLGTGVNAWLWQASLDTIGFLPLASADSNGGIIVTDWYSSPNNPNERVKVNIRIKDSTLRSDGVKVSVFRQVTDGHGGWADAASSPQTATRLEDTILARARELRMVAGQDKKKKKDE